MTSSSPEPFSPPPAAASDVAMVEHLRQNGPSSRAAVAAATGMSRPTASDAAERLLASGILRYLGKVQGGPGRAPELYDINPAAGHTLSLLLTSRRCLIRAHSLGREQLAEKEFPLGAAPSGPGVTEQVTQALTELSASLNTPCRAAVAALTAPVYPKTQRPYPIPGWPFPADGLDLSSAFAAVGAEQTRVDNDVNLSAIAECTEGAAVGQTVVLQLHVGGGVGAALVVDGTVVRGARGLTGEFSHVSIRGGTLSSILLDLGLTAPDLPLLDQALIKRLCAEDPGDKRLEGLVKALGEAAAVLGMVVDPDLLILGGPLSRAQGLPERILEAARTSLGEFTPPMRLGTQEPMRGAEILAQQLGLEALWSAYAQRGNGTVTFGGATAR
ncbi:ROK family transcriptional regulator [Arthrobacter sp. UM1]|uniref:ROK family transcriptional regulator n=1 Tax=Arthrobacter sp. UM1 TaxID=2766776 RepID=UPI001CF6CABC|nr:ROK family protein [Arthrobacter sp. UM1]MCB4209027.1 ROK family protein [Arthrobacter sp. UM1]